MALKPNFKSLIELSESVNYPVKEVWSVLSGGTTKDIKLAESLQGITGISAQALMFTPSKNVRQKILEWVSEMTEMTRTHAGRILYRQCVPGPRAVDKFVEFSGLEKKYWVEEKYQEQNWMLRRIKGNDR